MNRRTFMTIAGAAIAMPTLSTAQLAAQNPVRLVLVHGRSQQGRKSAELQSLWLDTLKQGVAKLNRTLPERLDVAFPFYGDRLDEFAKQRDVPLTTDIQAKGANPDNDFLSFQAEVAEAMRTRAGVTDAQLSEEFGAAPTQKGPQNWAWVQATIRAIDKHGGGISQSTIESFMRDVYLYTTQPGVQTDIDRIVSASLNEAPCVVVGHSLGSVVAYNVLRRDTRALKVRAFVTVGSPLAIRAIRDRFKPIGFPAPATAAWYNAYDPKDVVALYPLDAANFPVNPVVENYGRVLNGTDNRHGIIGYLNDPDVAKHILDGLQA
jgi:hypothetical protein